MNVFGMLVGCSHGCDGPRSRWELRGALEAARADEEPLELTRSHWGDALNILREPLIDDEEPRGGRGTLL